MKLLACNLRDAYALGMIECGQPDINDFIRSAAASWNASAEQESEYEQKMLRTKTEFHEKFRPIQAFRGRNVPFCNVLRLGDFSEYWINELISSGGDDAEHAGKQVPD